MLFLIHHSYHISAKAKHLRRLATGNSWEVLPCLCYRDSCQVIYTAPTGADAGTSPGEMSDFTPPRIYRRFDGLSDI